MTYYHRFQSDDLLYFLDAPTEVDVTLPLDNGLNENYTTYYTGEKITCTTDSSPAPTFEWFDLLTNETTDGAVLTIPNSDIDEDEVYQYICTATNVIRGDVNELETDIIEFMIAPGEY